MEGCVDWRFDHARPYAIDADAFGGDFARNYDGDLHTLIDRTREGMSRLNQGPLAGYMPYTRQTEGALRRLAGLKPQTLAVMHGSSYTGACDQLLNDLGGVIRENFDRA